MFEDSLIESAGRIHTKRGWTTVVSVGLQAVAIGVMILIPLIYTEALPSQMMTTFLVAPPPPPPPPPPAAMVKVTKIETEMENGALRTPTKIPEKVKMVKEEEAPPSTGMMGGVQGGVPGGALSGVIGGIIGSTANLPKVAAPQRIRVSAGVTAGNLIRKVERQTVYMRLEWIAQIAPGLIGVGTVVAAIMMRSWAWILLACAGITVSIAAALLARKGRVEVTPTHD